MSRSVDQKLMVHPCDGHAQNRGGEAHQHADTRLQTRGTHLRHGSLLLLWFSRSAVPNSSVTSWTVTHQAPPSMEFSRQEYRSRFSFARGSSIPRDQIWVFCVGRWIIYCWATKEAHRERERERKREKKYRSGQNSSMFEVRSWLLWVTGIMRGESVRGWLCFMHNQNQA